MYMPPIELPPIELPPIETADLFPPMPVSFEPFEFDPAPMPEILSPKFMDTGEAVAELQRQLRESGFYHGEIDGIYGTKTEDAVMRSQSERMEAI